MYTSLEKNSDTLDLSQKLFTSFSIFHKQKFALLAIFCEKINYYCHRGEWHTQDVMMRA